MDHRQRSVQFAISTSTMTVSAQLLLLLFVASSSHIVRALDCTTCQSETSWEDCQQTATVVSCSTEEVNDFHGVASIGNPTLTQGSPEDGFQCFVLHVRSKDSGPATSPDRFSKGCTFAQTEFCQGWSSTLEVVKCGTDEAGDVSFGGVGRLGAMGLVGMMTVGLFLRMI